MLKLWFWFAGQIGDLKGIFGLTYPAINCLTPQIPDISLRTRIYVGLIDPDVVFTFENGFKLLILNRTF